MHQDAAACRTDFALVDEHAEERTVDCRFEIGIGKEDVGRFSTQLQSDSLHRVSRLLHDDLADGSAARERDLINIRVLHDWRAAGLPKAGDDVHDTFRQPDFLEPLRHLQRCERSLLRWLEDARTSSGERWSQFPRRHQQRIVPGNNLSGNAHRLLQSQTHGVIGHRIDVAQNLRRQASVVLEAGRHVADIELGFNDRLPGIPAFQLCQGGCVLTYFFRQPEEHSAALLRRGRSPRAIFKRGLRRSHCAIHIF